MDNIRRRIVGVMFPPSKIDVRCVDFRRSICCPSKFDVTMCRPSEIDVSTVRDGCVDLRRPMIDVSTSEDR